MKKRRRKTHRAVPPFDLTPMIDVVLQLIIFFLFTSQFGELVRTEIDLPEEPGETTPAEESPDLTIDIDSSGRYLIASEALTLTEVEALARSEIASAGDAATVDVLIRPDRNIPARHLNELTQSLAGLGIRQAAIGTVAPAAPAGGGVD
ncbi:MAG: ExbD/TolR family protein [Phycisphaerales bacterium JB040]